MDIIKAGKSLAARRPGLKAKTQATAARKFTVGNSLALQRPRRKIFKHFGTWKNR
jgi:hypothetical protein